MRLLGVVLALVVGVGVAHADDKALKAYAGQIVLSPDTPPTSFDELPAFLKANATKDGSYELMKWDVNFVGVLAKAADKVTLTVVDPAKKTEALVSIELAVKRLVVVGSFKLTKAAGFETKKPYVVALTAGKAVVAKAELVLRE